MGGKPFIRRTILQVKNWVKRSQNRAIVVLEPVRGRADPNPRSCKSQAGAPSTALFWESETRGGRGRQARPGGGGPEVGLKTSGPGEGRSRVSGRALREGGTASWRQAPLLHTLSRASTTSQSEVWASFLWGNPSFCICPQW